MVTIDDRNPILALKKELESLTLWRLYVAVSQASLYELLQCLEARKPHFANPTTLCGFSPVFAQTFRQSVFSPGAKERLTCKHRTREKRDKEDVIAAKQLIKQLTTQSMCPI